MKNFLEYAKNRFLYNFLRFVIILLLGIVASNFMNIGKVYADVVSNTSTNYYYSDTTDVTHTTGFRTNPSTVELLGKDNYAPTYDKYEYLTGFDVYIPYNITQGSVYTVKVIWTVSNWSPEEFNVANFNARLNGTAIVGAVNGIISNQKTIYFTNNCSTYSGTQYCDYIFTTTYTFTATTTNTAFRVGTYNNKAFSLIGTGHYLISIVSVKEVDVITNNDSTIINQNEQIIEQNKQSNEKLEQAENTRKGIWETIKSFPSTFSNFFKDLGDKIGNFFTNLLNGILDGLKSLFIPGDGFFKTWFSDFKTFIEDKLGFLSTPFTIFIDFIESYSDLSSSNDIVINIPDITVPNFEDYKIISATTFNWSQTLKSKTSLLNLWNLYLDFIDVFLILNFIGLCEKTYNRIFGGDTSNYEYYTTEDTYNVDVNTGEVLSSKHKEKTTHRKKVDE